MKIKQRIRRLCSTIYLIASTAVITVGSILLLQTLCGIRMYHVLTGSMGELLPVGSVCFVSTYSRYENIVVGDVIAFRAGDDMLVTHRAIGITDAGIITQGDMSNAPDDTPVTKERYLGKTVFALPHVGRLLDSLHTLKGLLCVIVLFLLLFIGGLFYRGGTKEK